MPYLQRDPDTGGGCVLGCLYGYHALSATFDIQLSFSHNDNGEITGVNIDFSPVRNQTYIGPQGRLERTTIPGGLGFPDTTAVNISFGVLRALSDKELAALSKAVAGKTDFVSLTILQAVIIEQQRRAEEQRKKEEKKRKKCGDSLMLSGPGFDRAGGPSCSQ